MLQREVAEERVPGFGLVRFLCGLAVARYGVVLSPASWGSPCPRHERDRSPHKSGVGPSADDVRI